MRRFVVLALIVVGCARGGARGTPGAERGDCRAGDKPCDPGLLCLSNLCVRPPGADCAMVGETLASLDLGNYAELEERAPVVAKYKAACDKARVTKEEGDCLDAARDKWTASQCAPRMFPELAANKGNCNAVVTRLENALRTQLQAQDNPQIQQFIGTTLSVLRQSCEEDAWPDALKQCILTAQAAPGVDALQTCNQQMPPALQTKLQERLQTAMRTQMQ
jgi:hypothetical protein